ncbi:MAG TPA: SusD/RagB family nutrient-binding outer membrane lipoprotein, partial [Chitinophagaceae bacterium]|nr:SusD/RagB family nutrient-binding outer membrane lipoprotein [Chitinophagaceae bacterium]
MKKIIKLFLGLSIVLYLGGCTEDYLDINQSPNSPTVPELKQLLAGSQYYMVQSFGQGNFIGTGLSSYTHHLVSREVQNYGMNPGANNPFNTWNYLYTYVLKDFDAIIDFAEPDDNLIYSGIAKTLKAYAFSMMVDLWGDVPYSEFNVPGLTAPSPDSSKDIYNSLISLLEEGMSDLSNNEAENAIRPSTDDFFYSGDVDSWTRLNNTIKLKLLLQSRKAKSDITEWQSKLNSLITANSFIEEDEDFQFWFNNVTNPSIERHPAFESLTGQHTHFISPYFYETMMGHTY